MAKFEKHIPLSTGTAPGRFTVSTTSGTYVETAQPGYVLIDTSKYTGATFYFEAAFKVSAGTGYATLWDNTAGAAVSGAEVTTTSTSSVRVRSGAISPTSGNTFTDRIAASGGNTCTYYGGRVIVVQSAGTISATETQAVIYGYKVATRSAATYARPEPDGGLGMSWFLYTSANWNGTLNIYFEATLRTSGATGYAQLATNSGNPGTAVASSEVTTTSTSFTRVRSGAITLSDGAVYQVEIKNDGTNTTTIANGRLIFQQSGTITKSESYLPAGYNAYESSASGFADTFGRFYYDSANWSLDTIAWYAEYSRNGAGTLEMYALTSATRVTGSNVTSTATYERQRSGALTMPTTQDIVYRIDSGAGTIYSSVQHLVAALTWTNQAEGGGYIFIQP